MRTERTILLSCLLFSVCLASQAQLTPQTYQSLNGNWRISPTTGLTASSTGFQSFILTMGIDGDKVYGRGQLNFGCGDYSGLPVEGQISADGSFVLANTTVYAGLPAGSFIVQGKLPANRATEWHGKFSSQIAGHDGKCVPEEGDVLLRRLPAITGTFAGTVRSANGGAASEVTIEIFQKQLVSAAGLLPGTDHCVPVDVKMAIKGESRPFAGSFATTGNSCNDNISGDAFTGVFHVADGGTLLLAGFITYSDVTADAVTLMLTYLSDDKRRGVSRPVTASGKVMRQQESP